MRLKKHLRVHLTNVSAAGASELTSSLLPAMEKCPGYAIDTVFLPGHGRLSGYSPLGADTKAITYERYLPNALSRVLECTMMGSRFDGATPLLVLGDLPLRTSAPQTLFVQTALVTHQVAEGMKLSPKYALARRVFRMNASRVSAFAVQSAVMKRSLVATYGIEPSQVHIIRQPAPEWLLASGFRASARSRAAGEALRLFYPAAGYAHKNHALLAQVSAADAEAWPVAELRLTLSHEANPNKEVPWIRCVGMLAPESMLAEYAYTDALLFLSNTESYGFPLVEAMTAGLPIICADRDYARDLCGDEAIYFDARSAVSLRTAIEELDRRLHSGWWPDWTNSLQRIPASWAQVAEAFLRLATAQTG